MMKNSTKYTKEIWDKLAARLNALVEVEIEILQNGANGSTEDFSLSDDEVTALKVIRSLKEKVSNEKQAFKDGFHAETGDWWMLA